MYINCKNCHQTYTGHYCNNCGQTAKTHPINLHFLWHDILHGLLHFENGIAYTAKQLFTRPGHSIREYIEGKRVRHLKPISLVMVLATAYVALIHFLDIDLFVIETEQDIIPNSNIHIEQLKKWSTSHFAGITLLSIPLHTIGTAICFRKQGYNFFEYFVFNTYKAAQKLYIAILITPILYYYSGTPAIHTVTKTILLIDFVLYFWTNVQFFNHLPKMKTFILTLLTHIIFWFIILIICVIVLAIMG